LEAGVQLSKSGIDVETSYSVFWGFAEQERELAVGQPVEDQQDWGIWLIMIEGVCAGGPTCYRIREETIES